MSADLNRLLHSWTPLSLGAVLWAASSAAGDEPRGWLRGSCHYHPHCYSLQSRSNVQELFAQQAGNGLVLSQTIWSTQFEPGTAKLHYSGRAHLERLVRHSGDMPATVCLQTAQDIVFDSEAPETYASERDTLDLQRAKAVRDYLVVVLRQPEPMLYIHDPQRVGMWGYEADDVYGKLKLSGYGTLPPTYISGGEGSILAPNSESGFAPFGGVGP